MNAVERAIAKIERRAERLERDATDQVYDARYRLTSMVAELRWAIAIIEEEFEAARRSVRK